MIEIITPESEDSIYQDDARIPRHSNSIEAQKVGFERSINLIFHLNNTLCLIAQN